MSEVLTNEEIESLMAMVNSGDALIHVPTAFDEIAVGRFAESSLATPVDLLKPNRVSSEQMRSLEMMFEKSAEVIGVTMSDQLRYAMHCDCVDLEQRRFANWMEHVGDSAAIYVLEAPPLEQPLFFSVTKNLLYGWVDRVLGGHGEVTDVPEEISDAEFAVADSFLEPIFGKLVASMSELAEINIEIKDRLMNGSRTHLLPSQDVVISVHFQAGSDLLLGDLRLAIPYSALEPYLATFGRGTVRAPSAVEATRRVLSDAVRPVALDVAVHLGEAQVTLRRLLSLRVGDVLTLDQREGEPMVAPVAGVAKFSGRVGRVGAHLGFQVASVLE